MPVEYVVQVARYAPAIIEAHTQEILDVGTLEIGADDVLAFPEWEHWQTTPGARRQQRYRDRQKQGGLPGIQGGLHPDVVQVINHYREIRKPDGRLWHPGALRSPQADSKEVRAIRLRLREGYLIGELTDAIDGAHATPHNCGANERGQVYLGLELIMRSASQIDRFRTPASGTAVTVPRNAADRAVARAVAARGGE